MSRREMALRIAWEMYGLPYIWGGDDTIAGFDCSGKEVEILQSVGSLPSGDWTAKGLWDRFVNERIPYARPGALVFWQGSGEDTVRHVEMCIGDGLSIGASGGGSHIRDHYDTEGKLVKTALQMAIECNAFVKVRPIRGRGRVLGFVDPFLDD